MGSRGGGDKIFFASGGKEALTTRNQNPADALGTGVGKLTQLRETLIGQITHTGSAAYRYTDTAAN